MAHPQILGSLEIFIPDLKDEKSPATPPTRLRYRSSRILSLRDTVTPCITHTASSPGTFQRHYSVNPNPKPTDSWKDVLRDPPTSLDELE